MGALKVYTENGWEQVQTGGTSAEIPTTLPNPHKLTFSGAISAEYDGSEPVEVVIPQGGGGDEWDVHYKVNIPEALENGFVINEVDGKPLQLKEMYAMVKLHNATDTHQWMGCSITAQVRQQPNGTFVEGVFAGSNSSSGGIFAESNSCVFYVYHAKLLPTNGRILWSCWPFEKMALATAKLSAGANIDWLCNWLDYNYVDCITGLKCRNKLGAGTSQGYGTEIEIWGKTK